MAAITWSDVLAHAPELSSTDATVKDDLLAHANATFDAVTLGGEESSRLRLARIYLTAHMATLATSGGQSAASPVVEEAAGGLRRRYSESFGAPTTWNSTAYGQLLGQLIQTSAARVPAVI